MRRVGVGVGRELRMFAARSRTLTKSARLSESLRLCSPAEQGLV
jgi:hypothetical protein